MGKILFSILLLAIAIILILFLLRVRYDRLVNKIWLSLQSQPTKQIFTPETIADLDEPVQRYFLHAIAPGTPLASYVELKMGGSFRLQPDAQWIPMEASEIISTSGGFVWKAQIGRGLMKFSGADYYYQGKGRTKFSLWSLIPLVDAQSNNINRSGIGRLGGEYIWLPSALLPQNGITWQAIAENIIQANLNIDNEPITLTLTIDSVGKLLKISLLRWGDKTEDGSWQYFSFGAEVQAEKTFAGYTIPTKMNAGWGFGTDKYEPFFQPIIQQAKFN